MKPVLLLFKIIFILVIITDHGSSLYTTCGGLLEAEKGIIQTPNFPSPFPTPINCAWVIHNPHPEKKIILYFTQYFLKNSFHLSEYDEYISEHDNKGIKYLGEMNYINQFSSMAAYKPYLVIRFKVRDMGNMHLRVEEFLKDVYGFNITYEVVNQEQNIKEACSAHNCSFLGHCVANSVFSDYKCQCFPTFFGDYCQYGPFCDPSKGKNMCQNDGQCRYFMGSLVNVCDCTEEYRGDLCQEKKHEDLKDNDCKLGCSHDCERAEDGEYFCFCGDGFRLAADNTTCVEKEMYRISAEFPLKGVPFSSSMLNRIIRKRMKTFTMVKKMRIMGLSTATRLKYDNIRTEIDAKVMMFHFYVETAELSLVNDTIQGLITHGRFMNITVDLENIKYFVDPELKLLYVENYDKKPAVEGKLLTLACTARGSSNMSFKWYKDGYLVNVSVSDRNAWEVRIPKTMNDKQMSVLNIDGVTVYDKGEFTCCISDFGQVYFKSVMVDVITYPHIEVTPLAASRELGQSIGFRCVTPDDTRQTFDYQWYKNGVEIISDHGDEIIEELIPAGSRLAVRRVTSDANYTCYITNTAGTSNLTAHVFLLPGNKTNKICESERYEGVKWKRMGSGNFDIERCPTDTGGYSRRKCECKNGQCQWSQPNFAKCQSGHLVVIYDRLEKLRLGYQHDNMSDIFDTLYQFIKLASSKMLAGDVDVSCYILHTFIKTLWQFPIHTPQSGLFSYKSLMEVLDLLLQQAINSNLYEQKDLYVAPKLIDISMMLSKMDVTLLQITDGDSIQLPVMGFSTGNLTVIPTNLQPDGTTLQVTHKPLSHQRVLPQFKAKIKRGYSKLQQLNQSVVESHSKNTSLDVVEELLTDEGKKQVKSIVQFYFKKLFPLMKVEPYGESMRNPVSDVYSIYLLNNWESSEKRLEIFLQHTKQDQHLTIDNDTQCVKWIDHRMSFYGYWDASGCETISKNLTTTTCWCTVPGTFAVFIKPDESKDIEEVNMNNDIVLLVGCIISLCGLSATIIVYLFTWRKLVGNVHCIHVNLTLSLAIVNILCLMCLGKSSVESVCVAVKILLQFFYLATFAFMFVEAVHMFVSVHGGNRMTKSCIKYFLIGWGIPTVSTGCVVIASEKLGYDKMCTYWCWLSADHWHYYSFLIPMIVLIMAQVGLTLAVFVSVYHWTEEWRYSDRKQYLYQGIEMMIIQLLLTICCITGSKILQNTHVYSFVFIFSDITLSFLIFLFYCVLKKQKFARSSFRSFMLPEKVNESRSVEQTIQDHHNAVNKRKYTAERKRQLRFLVGSSGHYSGSSNSASTTVSGSGSDGTIRYKANSDNVDSGFSEETGSEQNCLVQLHPLQKGNVKNRKSGDSGSKDSYILADPASPVELTKLKEVNSLSINGNEPLLQNAPPKIVKNTRFVFATDGSNDPLLNQSSALIH